MKKAVLFFLIALPVLASTQNFEDVTDVYEIDFSFQGDFFGGGISFFDVNKDGLDDITLCNADNTPNIYFNQGDSLLLAKPIDSIFTEIKGFVWVDFDNDNDYDFSCAEMAGQIRLFRQDDNFTFTEVTEEAGLLWPTNESNFGLSWADFNSDGWLDLYVSRYSNIGTAPQDPQENVLYMSNGDGTFYDFTAESGTADGIRASFQPSVFDFDGDGDLDIFQINDRIAFPNSLYSNQGNGIFTDVSSLTGVDLSFDAMTNTVFDYNHDGYLDIYCTNNGSGNYLFKWEPELFYFQNQFPNSGAESYNFNWGATAIDYNNDSWEDLVITSVSAVNKLFTNTNGTFTLSENDLNAVNLNSYSVAKGDINNDFKSDLFINNEDPHSSHLYLNVNAENNHALKVSFEGTVSNKDAIGTEFIYYIDGLPIKKTVFCGTNYMNQESQYHLIGLGQDSLIDSLFINWPSGIEQLETNLYAGESYHFIESLVVSENLNVTENQILCEGDSLLLSADFDFLEIHWNNGSSDTNQVSVFNSGLYNAMGLTLDSIPFETNTVSVVVNNVPVLDSLLVNAPLCYGEVGSAQFYINSGMENYTLEINSELSLDSLTHGNYSYTISDSLECTISGSFEIVEPSMLVSLIETEDVSCFGQLDGQVTFSTFGGTAPYTILGDSLVDFMHLTEGTYNYSVTDANGCELDSVFSISQPDSLYFNYEIFHALGEESGHVSMSAFGGIEPYSFIVNGELSEPFSEQEIGEVCMQILDANQCVSDIVCDSIQFISHVNEIQNKSLLLYPNPVSNELRLDLRPNASKVIVYNTNGQVVINTMPAEVLDVSSLKAGAYTLSLITNGGVFSGTFIKENSP